MTEWSRSLCSINCSKALENAKSRVRMSMCFLTVSSRPCLETSPHSILRTPFAGHCLGALWGGKPCPVELSEGVNRVLRTLSGDLPLPILQTPSAGHCLDTHGMCLRFPFQPLVPALQTCMWNITCWHCRVFRQFCLKSRWVLGLSTDVALCLWIQKALNLDNGISTQWDQIRAKSENRDYPVHWGRGSKPQSIRKSGL